MKLGDKVSTLYSRWDPDLTWIGAVLPLQLQGTRSVTVTKPLRFLIQVQESSLWQP